MPPPVPPSVNDGPDDGGKPDILERFERSNERLDLVRARRLEPDPGHRLAEPLAILGLVDGVGGRADHGDAEFSRTPMRRSDSAVLSAVCPPMVGKSASGRSFSMILATISGVIGSM